MGFEPTNGGFAIHCVSHFATAPSQLSMRKTTISLVRKVTHVDGAKNPDWLEYRGRIGCSSTDLKRNLWKTDTVGIKKTASGPEMWTLVVLEGSPSL